MKVIITTISYPNHPEVEQAVFGRLNGNDCQQVFSAMELDFIRLCDANGHQCEIGRAETGEWLSMRNITANFLVFAEIHDIGSYEEGLFDHLFD